MNSLRSIVAATDFSAPARHAAWRAAMLAQAKGVPMTLMHTVGNTALDDLRRWLGDGGATSGLVEADAHRHLQEQAAEINRRYDIAVHTQLTIGHPVEQITCHLDDVDAGLLVTGTRGAGFLRSGMIGSTAERVAKRSSRPVLLVRQLPHEPYQRILVPVDFSDWSGAAIDLARQMAPQATLILMHAVHVFYEGKLRQAGVDDEVVMRYCEAARREAQEHLRDLAADAGLDPGQVRMTTPAGAAPWMLILKEEQEQDCDLVVIGRQGRNAVNEFLLGSTTRMVVAEGAADVLISSQRSR